MNTITKTETLDACVDGRITNLKYLLGDKGYDQFGVFYDIIKDIDLKSPSVSFRHNDSADTLFEVACDVTDEKLTTIRETHPNAQIDRDGGNRLSIRITV